MKGYWIGHLTVHDPEGHGKNYVPLSTAAIHKYGGRFLVRGGENEQPEGSARDRHVIIEFPSYRAARDCYHSADYQAARSQRTHTATADITIVEGADAL